MFDSNYKFELIGASLLALAKSIYYSKPVKIYRGEEPVNKFMHEMLKKVDYCKATMRKHFRKSLVMSDDEEDNYCLTQVPVAISVESNLRKRCESKTSP